MTNKKGVSPLVATLILIIFAIALGAVIMNCSRGFGQTSEADVSAMIDENSLILENSNLKLSVSRIGTPEGFELIDTSRIINSIQFKNSKTAVSGFTFPVGYSSIGTGYTILEQEGKNLNSGTIRVHISYATEDYDLIITLASNSELFTTSIENLVVK